VEAQKAAFEANTDAYAGLEGTWMAYKNPEVLPHYPPQYIIGKQVDEAREIAVHEHELVTVRLYEVKNEWMYSNPTGMFNLSLPDKAHKDSNYKIVTYAEYKENLAVNNDTAAEKASGSEFQIELKPNVDPVLLRLEVLNKAGKTLKVDACITSEDDANVSLPFGGTRTKVYSGMTDATLAGIFQKINPSKPFGKLTLQVDAQFAVKAYTKSNITASNGIGEYVSSGVGTGTADWNDSYAEAVSNQGSTQPFFVTGSSLVGQGRR